MNNQRYIRVRNTEVLSLVRKGMEIYEVDGNEMELLNYGTDRIQPDLIYLTPMNMKNLLTKAQQEQSGFSFRPLTNEIDPTKGYMVSLPNHELILSPEELVDKGMEYFEKHKDTHYFIGCWYSDGKFYLDLSENVQFLGIAMALGKHHNQKAIWDCTLGVSIDVN